MSAEIVALRLGNINVNVLELNCEVVMMLYDHDVQIILVDYYLQIILVDNNLQIIFVDHYCSGDGYNSGKEFKLEQSLRCQPTLPSYRAAAYGDYDHDDHDEDGHDDGDYDHVYDDDYREDGHDECYVQCNFGGVMESLQTVPRSMSLPHFAR